MNPCHYSLLQYRPDASREEGLNVGVVVVRAPDAVVVETLDSDDLRVVLQALRVPRGEWSRAERALASISARLRRLRDASAQGLREFAASEAGAIELLPPHAVATGAPVDMAPRLFTRLVRPNSSVPMWAQFDPGAVGEVPANRIQLTTVRPSTIRVPGSPPTSNELPYTSWSTREAGHG